MFTYPLHLAYCQILSASSLDIFLFRGGYFGLPYMWFQPVQLCAVNQHLVSVHLIFVLVIVGTTTTTRSKAAVGQRKPSGGLRSSQLNAQGANCTLSSQGDGNALDPWDANAPLGAEMDESKMGVKHMQRTTTQTRSAIPRPSTRPLTRSMKSGASPHKGRSPEKPQRFSPRLTQKSTSKDQVTGQGLIQKSTTGSSKPQDVASEIASITARQEQDNAGDITREASAVDHNEGGVAATCGHQKESQEVGPNVVDAIEGLLRQTSKVSNTMKFIGQCHCSNTSAAGAFVQTDTRMIC